MDNMINDRKKVARKRIRGFLILLIVILSIVLIYDVYLLIGSGL